MRKTVFAAAFALGALAAPAFPAAAMTLPAPAALGVVLPGQDVLVQKAHFCGCGDRWGHRHYWQWGWHPDRPLPVVPPGARYSWSISPPLVPADMWARKWHPPGFYHWRRHRVRLRQQPEIIVR